MINIKINTLLAISFVSFNAFATDYDNATFDNFVDGQGVNEALQDAQFILCSLSRFGTESLAGDGTYKATIYTDECESAGAAATDSSQGTTAPSSANSTSTSSSSSAGQTAATTNAKEVDTVIINTGFVTQTLQKTKAWIINDEPFSEEEREPKSITYLLNEQTAPASASNRFGDFTLRYQSATYGNTQEEFASEDGGYFYECPDESSRDYSYSWCSDGVDLGRGILKASGTTVQFKDEGQRGQSNVVAEYLANGDIAGVYTKNSGFQDDTLRDERCDDQSYLDANHGGDWWQCQPELYRNSSTEVLGVFAFGISADDKSYCTYMSALYKVNWELYDEATNGPTLTSYTLSGSAGERLESEGWDVNEKCFSIDKADAIKDIWDYGVFNSDKSRFNPTNQSFPIRAEVTVSGIKRDAHGYASYWGVHVDPDYQDLVDDNTEWVREDDNSETPAKYNVKNRKLVVEKREKNFLALDELDGLNLNFWTNDSYWSEEFQKLGFAKVEPWDGKIQFKTNKAVFTDYNNGSSSEPLVYNLYGSFDGDETYVANLSGAKIDKDNIRKIIKNNPSDPGKPMNLSMEFSEFPNTQYYYEGKQDTYVGVILCNGSSINYTRRTIYDANQINIGSDQQCISIGGNLKIQSDGTSMVLSSDPDGNYSAMFKDGSTGTQLYFDSSNWNTSGHVYDFIIQKGGIDRPAGLEVKVQQLFRAFGSLSQLDDNGGNISGGLESFLDSSNSFTFLVSRYEDMFDHNGNAFNNISGTFNVSSTPPATVFVDDVFVIENTGTGVAATNVSTSFSVSLSEAQSDTVTFDYTISSSSTASAGDYSDLSAGTVTIAAGATSASIPLKTVADEVAEGVTDETIVLSLSNASSNIVLGRTNPTAYIYDDDTNRVVYEDYVGSYSATSKTFSVTHGLLFDPNYSKTKLPAPITFTLTEWLANMFKTHNVGTEWEEQHYRDLNVYSQDTNKSYTISRNSFANPTSNSSSNGIATESWTIVPASELPAKLYCIQDCLSSGLTKAHYTDVKNQADPNADGSYEGSVGLSSPSPYVDVGPYIKTTQSITTTYNSGEEDEYRETRDYTRGDWQDGIISDDVYVYTTTNNVLNDAEGEPVEIGVDWGTTNVYEKIQGANFVSVQGGWKRESQWGVNTGTLVTESMLPNLECDYATIDGVKVYTAEHAEYTAANGKISKTRYCANNLYQSKEITTSYSIRLETYKQYEIFNTDGSNLTFNPPKVLYFTAPDDAAKFGDDAGKKFRLELNGGYLGGIPGSVIDINTGEDLGEYVNEWKDSYRYVQRFVIPDGSVLTENISSDTYLVKALAGQEWLGKKDSAIGTLSSLLNLKDVTNLLDNTDLDWEVSNKEISDWECTIKIQVDDGNGGTYEDTDWDACYAIESDDSRYAETWILKQTWANCTLYLQYSIDEFTAMIQEWKAEAAAGGYEYSGPNTWQDDTNAEGSGFADYMNDALLRCKSIGVLPTSLINGGNASVINGTVVYDPTP
jgi:hypothetical protein|tara:strand:- start:607 stop:5088 length:4482 start_codon:yes stop_codon:yes gene_type:complete